jgi:subtilisin family serine protease
MADRPKLDPGLRYVASLRPFDRKFSAVASFTPATATIPAVAKVMVQLAVHDDAVLARLREAGFIARTRDTRAGPRGSRAPTVLTGEIPLNRISLLEGIEGLTRVEASRPLWPELDFAVPEARVDVVHGGSPPRRGAGVLVGIIDHGIDYKHQSFRNADGSTRILAIWDQFLTAPGSEPAGFTFGVEYQRAAINAALVSGVDLQHADRAPFHGTHVSGIAAGNGQPDPVSGSPLVGVAPEAELIVVAARGPATSLADSSDVLDAVRYIVQLAESEGKPVAINMSLGDNVGPHDGTSFLETGIAEHIAGPGRAFINSAGNEGVKRRHAQGVLPVGGSHDVQLKVSDPDDEVIVDIWYPGASRINLRITPPGSAMSPPFVPPFDGTVALTNGNTAFIGADLTDPINGDNRTFVVLQAGTQASVQKGIWTLRLEGDGPWHGWIQLNSTAAFRPPFVSDATTITTPASSSGVISAGCYISDCRFTLEPCGTLSALSSHGPTRDGRQVPTVSAPGQQVTAPQPGDHFVAMSGTSMSAAMVTGAVALIFEIDPTKTASDIRACLEATARLDADTGPAPSNEWGAGKLDADAACQSV